jgi:hypothetical protein
MNPFHPTAVCGPQVSEYFSYLVIVILNWFSGAVPQLYWTQLPVLLQVSPTA